MHETLAVSYVHDLTMAAIILNRNSCTFPGESCGMVLGFIVGLILSLTSCN